MSVRTLAVLGTVALAAVLLTGCGSPPEPPLTAPPGGAGSLPAPASFSAVPLPIPTVTPPTYTPPVYTPPAARPTTTRTTATRTPTPTRPTSTVSPAPSCRSGPSKDQVLTAVRAVPGVPTDGPALVVSEGPFCAGTWQFATVVSQGSTADPLLVVTRGTPTTLQVVAAGGDVCTDEVEDDAPPGIRVRACGF